MRYICAVVVGVALAGTAAAQDIVLAPFATGFTRPVAIAHAGDARLFVVEKRGVIRVVQSDGTVLPTPFLDLTGQVATGNEQGLLGLAFHPDYADNGFFYINYTDTAGDTVVARYTVSGDPNVADEDSALPVLAVDQPFANHNGGDLHFGPADGYLYISLGDGGAFCDPADNAQNGASLLGKLLRIDVDTGSPYAIPPDNPFVGPDGIADEIWAVGLRNPWRIRFDRLTHDLYIGDVGQNRNEEIDFQPAASAGGENYGWDCREGFEAASLAPSSCNTTAPCLPLTMFTEPVTAYSHANGCSVTGGVVYRGSAIPELAGTYLYADYCAGELLTLRTADGGMTWDEGSFGTPVANLFPTAFSEDVAGEVYVASDAGTVYRVERAATPPPCPAEPAAGCSAPGKSLLIIKRAADPAKSKLTWKWLKGPALTQADFGDPVDGSTAYHLCLYAGTASAGLDVGLPGGSHWKAIGTKGFKYKDPAAAVDGAINASLKGGNAGKSKLLLKAKGQSLDLSALPLGISDALTAQLIRNDSSTCWAATYPAASIRVDTGDSFKAKAP